jgi:hypothetical protein
MPTLFDSGGKQIKREVNVTSHTDTEPRFAPETEGLFRDWELDR